MFKIGDRIRCKKDIKKYSITTNETIVEVVNNPKNGFIRVKFISTNNKDILKRKIEFMVDNWDVEPQHFELVESTPFSYLDNIQRNIQEDL